MQDLEKVYDEEVSPLMQQIIAICQRHGMPMFAEFQYHDNDFCKTRLPGADDNGHALFDHLDALTQCMEGGGINIDKYMFWVIKQAKKTGHGSMILSQLGVPAEPEAAPPAPTDDHDGKKVYLKFLG